MCGLSRAGYQLGIIVLSGNINDLIMRPLWLYQLPRNFTSSWGQSALV